MTHELFPWIQPVSEAMLALLAVLSIIVLMKYAADTRIIAKNSSKQVENSQKPFVAPIKATEFSDKFAWALKNQGFGPAINVSYSGGTADPSTMQSINSLAVGEQYPLPGETGNLEKRDRFTVEFQSLSGKKYSTTVTWTDGKV
jgi:hypothetical protein